jgi:hypothetical protein
MFRYLLWRLRFEACNIRRLFGHGDERLLYLAFGANLSDAILRERRITPFAARPFTLREYGLRFDHPAPWAGCGYASAEPAPGESLHGYLYTLSGRDAARMDYYEVVPVLGRYRRTVVEQDGEEIFFYQTNRSAPGLKPSAEYLGYIVEGLKKHPEVGADYLAAIGAIETGEPGELVPTYHADRTGPRDRWHHRAADACHRFSLRVFIGFLYRFSPTAPLIRPARDDDLLRK